MANLELIFRIAGEAYQQVCEYRRQMDFRVICNQFERVGSAMIVSLKGQPAFGSISELPVLGEAVPWYGDVGTGYTFLLRPSPEGCSLKVENVASGHILLCRETLPSLELNLPESILLKQSADEADQGLLRHVGYAYSEDETGREILLSVTPDIYPRLAAWPRYGEPLTHYEFDFHPISVGNQIYVQHMESGEVIDLTEGIEW